MPIKGLKMAKNADVVFFAEAPYGQYAKLFGGSLNCSEMTNI